MKDITLCMIIKNEEDKLRRSLESAQKYFDSIVVVDTGSTDGARDTAVKSGCEVFDFAWIDDFSAARNFSISKAKRDWIFILDSDEYITSFNEASVAEFVRAKKAIGRVKRTDSFMVDGILGQSNCYTLRLFPCEVGYTGRIHEQLDSPLPRVTVPVVLFHDGYEERAAEKAERNLRILRNELTEHPSAYIHYQLSREYKYIEDYARENEELRRAYYSADKLAHYFPVLCVHYLYNLIKLRRFKDGLNVIEAQKSRFDGYPDFHFVCGLFYMDLVLSDVNKYGSYFNRIEASYLKCIAIGENHTCDGVIGTGSFLALHNLGAFYESMGKIDKAKEYYAQAVVYDYAPSLERFGQLK